MSSTKSPTGPTASQRSLPRWKIGATAKPIAGQDDRRAGDAAEALDGDREGAAAGHRLALEVPGGVRLGTLRPTGRLGSVLLVRSVAQQLNLRKNGVY